MDFFPDHRFFLQVEPGLPLIYPGDLENDASFYQDKLSRATLAPQILWPAS
jgi:hypothetical protein